MGKTCFYVTVKMGGITYADEMRGFFDTRAQAREDAINWALTAGVIQYKGILVDDLIRRLEITIRPDLRGFISSEPLDEIESYRQEYPSCSSCESEEGTCVGIFSEADEAGLMLARFLCWQCAETARKLARDK